VSSSSVAKGRRPQIASGLRPIIFGARLRHGTTPWSRTPGCRHESASKSYATYSLGLPSEIRASRSSVGYSSARRCKSSRRGSTPSSTTRATSTQFRRRNCSWGAYRTTFASMWRCAHPKIFIRRSTWPAPSSYAPTASWRSFQRTPNGPPARGAATAAGHPGPDRVERRSTVDCGCPAADPTISSPHTGGAAGTPSPRHVLELRRALRQRPPVQTALLLGVERLRHGGGWRGGRCTKRHARRRPVATGRHCDHCMRGLSPCTRGHPYGEHDDHACGAQGRALPGSPRHRLHPYFFCRAPR
jgi:hypothetical protein